MTLLAKWIDENTSHFSGDAAKGYGRFNQRKFWSLGCTQGTLNLIEQCIQDAITVLCHLMAHTFASYTDATEEMYQTNTPAKTGPPVARVEIPTVVTIQDEEQKTPAASQSVSTPSTWLSPVPIMGGLHPDTTPR